MYVCAMAINFAEYVDDQRIVAAAYQGITTLVGASFPTQEFVRHAYLDHNSITTLAGVTFPDNLT
jgi:hypothetical protein